MTKPYGMITVPDVIDEFRRYFTKNPAWGSLHIVLDDGNYDKQSILFCNEYAANAGDIDGAILATKLLQLTKTQIRNLSRLASSPTPKPNNPPNIKGDYI